MKTITAAAAFTVLGLSSAFAAGPAPCEDMLKDLRTAEASAKIDPAVKAQYEELKAKGVERCNADDDKRADQFFADTMKALGK